MSRKRSRVNFEVPRDTCDCHTHIFGDAQRFPFSPERAYTPGPASVAQMRALCRALHTSRVVVVQPSVYGTDNACTLNAIRQLGTIARGIAVVDDQTPGSTLGEMHRSGIRGVRLNLQTEGLSDHAVVRQRFQRLVARLRGLSWHIQLYTQPSLIEAISDQIMATEVPVVFDHFGGAQASLGTHQAGFPTLLNLVRTGKAYVKISAPYLVSAQALDYPDVAPLAKALIAANPQRILWGSNWPHPDASKVPGRKTTDIAPPLEIDDGRVFNQLATWEPDPARRQAILVDNPARLYGF